MKIFNKFLMISAICMLVNQNVYSSAAAKPAETEKAKVDNPIALILSMTLLKSCLDADCWGTQGQLPKKNEWSTITFSPNDPVEVWRGFNAAAKIKGKIKGNIVMTSLGRAKSPKDMIEVFKLAPSEFAFYASQVVPIDTIRELSTKDDAKVIEELTKYYEANPDLVDPSKIYVVEGSTTIYHYTSLRPAVYGPVPPAKPADKDGKAKK